MKPNTPCPLMGRPINRRSLFTLTGILLSSSALTACSQTGQAVPSKEDPTSDRLDGLVSFVEDFLDSPGYDYCSVYTNDDRTKAFFACLRSGDHLYANDIFLKKDGKTWYKDDVQSFDMYPSLSLDHEIEARLSVPSLKNGLLNGVKPYYEIMQDSMIDPDSAKYDKISVVFYPDKDAYKDADELECDESFIVRFDVNAKNRFGGYTGKQSHILYKENGHLEYIDEEDKYKFEDFRTAMRWIKDTYPWLCASFDQEDME